MPAPMYTPDLAARFYAACCLGKSIKEIASEFMVRTETINRWAKDEDKPEFKEAYELGKEAAEVFYEKMGRENLTESKPYFKESLYKFITGVRFNWSEKHEQTIKKDETPANEAELDQLIKNKMEQLGYTPQDVNPE